jgi:SAM-dependent methyltransferase
MGLIERIHGEYVFKRRVRVLSRHLVELIPPNAQILDVGCGDGRLGQLIMQQRPDVQIKGIDVLIREHLHIPVKLFDGRVIPHADKSFDVVMFIDVLHHISDPELLVREAARVSRANIIIKDHLREALFADATLRFMDWVGNERHGVVLPYNFWSRKQWREFFAEHDLKVAVFKKTLNIYPRPASWLFDRSLHFIAQLNKNNDRPS